MGYFQRVIWEPSASGRNNPGIVLFNMTSSPNECSWYLIFVNGSNTPIVQYSLCTKLDDEYALEPPSSNSENGPYCMFENIADIRKYAIIIAI